MGAILFIVAMSSFSYSIWLLHLHLYNIKGITVPYYPVTSWGFQTSQRPLVSNAFAVGLSSYLRPGGSDILSLYKSRVKTLGFDKEGLLAPLFSAPCCCVVMSQHSKISHQHVSSSVKLTLIMYIYIYMYTLLLLFVKTTVIITVAKNLWLILTQYIPAQHICFSICVCLNSQPNPKPGSALRFLPSKQQFLFVMVAKCWVMRTCWVSVNEIIFKWIKLNDIVMNNKIGLHIVSHETTFVVTGSYINKNHFFYILKFCFYLTFCSNFLNWVMDTMT